MGYGLVTLVCPNGHRAGRVPIVYGDPMPETMQQAERGEIVLGGCVIFGDDPEWACSACHEPLSDSGSRSGSDGQDARTVGGPESPI